MSSTAAAFGGLLNRTGDRLGTTVLLLLASLALFRFTPALIALGLLLAVTALQGPRVWRQLRPASFTWVALAYLAYVALFGLGWAWAIPAEAGLILDETVRYLYTGYLGALLVAYWVVQRPDLVPAIIGLLPVGLLARVAWRWEEGNGAQVIQGLDRARFGDSAVHIGLWSLVALLCGLYLLLDALQRRDRRHRWLILAAGLTVTPATSMLLFFSQTRTAWLLALVLVPSYMAAFCLLGLRGRQRGWVLAGMAAVLAAVLAGTAMAFPDLLQHRWAESAPALAAVVSGDWANIPSTSVGLRLHLIGDGLAAWSQAPWTGWGPGSDAAVLAGTDSPVLASRSFEHFHSSLLVYAVELGTAGAVLSLLLFAIPIAYLVGAIRQRMGVPEALWTLSCLVVIVGGAMADRVLDSYRGPFVSALLVGTAVGLHLHRREPAASASAQAGGGA